MVFRCVEIKTKTIQLRHNERDGVSNTGSIVCSGADQGKHQSSASLAFVRGIHVAGTDGFPSQRASIEMVPLDDVIMKNVHMTCQLRAKPWRKQQYKWALFCMIKEKIKYFKCVSDFVCNCHRLSRGSLMPSEGLVLLNLFQETTTTTTQYVYILSYHKQTYIQHVIQTHSKIFEIGQNKPIYNIQYRHIVKYSRSVRTNLYTTCNTNT